MDSKPAKPKRLGNHYIPPPARKQGSEQHDFSRIKERPIKLLGVKQEKLCDDSSLLFKDSSPKVEEKSKAKRKSKNNSKKANAENTSFPKAVETPPAVQPYGDSDKSSIQHTAPHGACNSPDKVLVKSHFPLNDLENARSRDANNVETRGKCLDGDPINSRQLVSMPCPPKRNPSEDAIVVNDVEKADLRPVVNERVGDLAEAPSKKAATRYVLLDVECPPVSGLVCHSTNEIVEEMSEGPTKKVATRYFLVDVECPPVSGFVCSQGAEISRGPNVVSFDAVLAEPHGTIVTKSNNREATASSNLSPLVEFKSRKESNSTASASVKSCDSNLTNLGAPAVSRHSESKPRPSRDGSLELISIDDGDWDVIYDDTGDCLIPQSTPSSKQPKARVENSLAKMQISPKQPLPTKSYENSSSIIEIYGFSENLKTNDLLSVFGNFINRGFNLKWVDNTHALGIFPSTSIAEEALRSNLPLVKTRPIALGTPLSQERARTLVLPSSLRPKTCSALARRLVSGALGLRVKATPEERAAERELLREAREQKKLVSKQRDAAWEGVFPSPESRNDKPST